RSLIESIKKTVIKTQVSSVAPVILTPIDIRRFTRKVIERDFPSLAVLSYQELTASANIQPLDRIKLSDEEEAAPDFASNGTQQYDSVCSITYILLIKP